MANADFSRQQNQPTGGFDASSYRAAAPAEEEVRLTPFQQKLASLEKALPAALVLFFAFSFSALPSLRNHALRDFMQNNLYISIHS